MAVYLDTDEVLGSEVTAIPTIGEKPRHFLRFSEKKAKEFYREQEPKLPNYSVAKEQPDFLHVIEYADSGRKNRMVDYDLRIGKAENGQTVWYMRGRPRRGRQFFCYFSEDLLGNVSYGSQE